jgi:prevent-host-death family protein
MGSSRPPRIVSILDSPPPGEYGHAMEAAYTVDDARALFPDMVEEARATHHPVYVTDDAGEPVVAIVDMLWLERCEKLMAASGAPV